MMPHPSFRTLARFAGGELSPIRRPRLARHLERCPACRATVTELRTLPPAVETLTSPAPPAGAWDAIAARVAAGEPVILPAADPAPRARRMPRAVVRIAATVAVLLAAGAASVMFTREAAAEISELRLAPERPGPGATVRVAYRPGSLLAGEDRLVLRARMLGPADPTGWGAPVRRVAELRRDGDVYTGAFTLPDSVVYAVFAVEDEAAARVDHNGQQWELVVHGPDGRPLYDALLQRSSDLYARDMQRGTEVARQAARLYPQRVAGWYRLFFGLMETAPRAQQDSLTREHRARVRTLSAALRGRAGVTPEEAADMVHYAGAVDDTATASDWRQALYALAPDHPLAYQQRVAELREQFQGDTAGATAALERLWREAGTRAPQLPFDAYMRAVQRGDAQGVVRWSDRLLQVDSAILPAVARGTLRMPELRAQGMERARQAIRWLEATSAQRRPLTHTAAEQARETDGARGYFLGQLGRALVQAGQTRAGMDTLALALEVSWDDALFRTVADTRLAMGDTAGAAGVLARLAVDPSTGPAFADSARARLGRHVTADAWARQVQSARGEMRKFVMRGAVNRPVRGTVSLAGMDGGGWTMDPENPVPTVVAVWSRWCLASRQQLGELQRVTQALRERGIRVVTITHETPDAEFREFLAENGLTFPIYLDTDRAAQRALQNQGTPSYLVLDPRGRIRFDTHGLEDLLRQTEVLRGTGGTGE